MKKRRKRPRKLLKRKLLKRFIGISVILVCMSITAAVTLALLMAQSGIKKNVFTGTAGLEVEVYEPNWDSPGGGQEKATNYSPNLEIPKNPYLQNETKIKPGHEDDSKEYVAIRLTYQINAVNPGDTGGPKWETVSYSTFQKLADVYCTGVDTPKFNLAANASDIKKWIPDDDGENKIFYYNTILNGTSDSVAFDKTSTLFDYVKINGDLETGTLFKCDKSEHYDPDTGTITTGNHKGLIGFRIVVEGFAVQAYENRQDIGLATAKARLKELMNDNLAPTDSPTTP